MKTKTFEAMSDSITPCCGYSTEDVELTPIWEDLYTGCMLARCTCGRIIKLDQVLQLITVMERE